MEGFFLVPVISGKRGAEGRKERKAGGIQKWQMCKMEIEKGKKPEGNGI
jgi:hypothetical protein